MVMHLDFPASPVNGDLYPTPAVADMPQYIWNGYAWVLKSGGGGGSGSGGTVLSDSPPLMDGNVNPGIANNASRGDHVHPKDTTKADASYVNSQDALKVNKAGDTMTGAFTVQMPGPVINLDMLTVTSGATIQSKNNGALRWRMYMGNGAAEGGSNAGSDFGLYRCTDAGAQVGLVMGASRANGGVSFESTITAGASIVAGANASTGTYYFGNSGTRYFTWDGTSFSLNGGFNVAGAVRVTGDITAYYGANAGTYRFGSNGSSYLTNDGTQYILTGGPLNINNSINITAAGVLSISGYSGNANQGIVMFGNQGTHYLYFDGTNYVLPNAPLYAAGVNATTFFASGGVVLNSGLTLVGNMVHQASAGYQTLPGYGYTFGYGGSAQWGLGFRPASDVSHNSINFTNAAGTSIGGITCTSTSTAYGTSSSGELKEDLKSFDSGRIIDSTNVYDFKWRSTGERSYGVIAQQAIEVYPTAVSHLSNPETKEEYWAVDYSKYVPVLLQEIKALRERVFLLENGTDLKPTRQ